jgi:hypothetical protein
MEHRFHIRIPMHGGLDIFLRSDASGRYDIYSIDGQEKQRAGDVRGGMVDF